MKIKVIFLAVALLFIFPTVFAQNEKTVAEIRREVTAINKSLKTYKQKKKDVEANSTEGAESTYYSSREDLKKITAKIYGETYNATADFYYRDRKLIFVYFKLNRYDTQIGLSKPVKVIKIEEERLYFADGKMFKLLVGKLDEKSGSEKWQNSEREMLELSEQLKKQF